MLFFLPANVYVSNGKITDNLFQTNALLELCGGTFSLRHLSTSPPHHLTISPGVNGD